MNKIVIASDSFKGSLSSAEVADAASAGIKDVSPSCEVIKLITGDGGEGTCEAIAGYLSCEWTEVMTYDPLGRPIEGKYAICSGTASAAIIELAEASGLTLLKEHERNPLKTSTFGTGLMIMDAAEKGCRNFIIGLGGSATNDAGTGMMEALGFRFLDKEGNIISGCCGDKLVMISDIDTSEVPQSILSSSFTVACDVDTVFYGKAGATYIFAPQKGADGKIIEVLEEGMKSFSKVIRKKYGIDLNEIKGSGAAGGAGGALHSLLNAGLSKGADLVLDTAGFEEIIEGADLIITGEGKIDSQSICGKLPFTVLRRASAKGIPVVAIGGLIDLDEQEIKDSGFLSVLPIQPRPADTDSLAAAMNHEKASRNIRLTMARFIRSLMNGYNDGLSMPSCFSIKPASGLALPHVFLPDCDTRLL